MVTYREGKCFLGKTLVLSDGKIELEVTLEVGPRVISLKKITGENIMFHDENNVVNRDVSKEFGEGKVWRIYGGHRIWLSPESEYSYYPDDSAVAVEKTANGAIFTPSKWDVVEILPSFEVEMLGDGVVRMKHFVKNLASYERPLCIWVLTVLKTGGEGVIPLSTEDTGLLANRNLVFWPYTDIQDKRISITNTELKLRGIQGSPSAIKIGLFKKDLKTVFTLGDTIFTKTVLAKAEAKDYPDFNCNLQTYTSAHIHEIETLSPLVNIAPGAILTHEELWEVK